MEHTGRKIIGVAGGWLKLENSANLIHELQIAAQPYGYIIACFSFTTNSDEDNEEVMANLHLADLAGWTDLSALVILGETLHNETIIGRLISYGRRRKIPVFLAERRKEGVVNIKVDYADGFENMVRHVVEFHGCRRVAMMAGMHNNSFSDERIAVYRKVLEENGIAFDEKQVMYGDFWDGPTRKEIERMLATGDPLPEAIVCANDSMAVAVCDTLEAHGHHVPDDIIVTGFDGIPQGKNHEPVITTCEPNFAKEARIIVDITNQWTPDQDGQTLDYEIGYHVTPRQSCGCESRENYNWNGIITSLTDDLLDSTNHISEMGRLVDRLINMDSVYDVTAQLQHRLGMWHGRNHYYCVVAASNLIPELQLQNKLVPLYHCWYQEENTAMEPYDEAAVLPDFDRIRQEDCSINVIYFRLMSVMEHFYGFVCSGFDQPDTRDFQRLEELGMFMSSTVNTILNNRRLEELNRNLQEANTTMQSMSEHDYLTGIYNRRGFFARLDRELRDPANQGRTLTFISIDLDGLKRINDNYGHGEGDRAIVALSKAVSSLTADNGLASRYGGDEFAAALIGDHPLGMTAEDLRREYAEPIRQYMGDVPFKVEASIGIATGTISFDLDLEHMMNLADERMYRDKTARHQERR